MTAIIVALAIAMSSSSSVLAQQSLKPLHVDSLHIDATAKPRQAAKAKPCPEYGPGFVRIQGSSTCIKIGGWIRVEAGTAVHR